ncbi:28S ribosomal protein S28, mitochondrial-like [Gigantopelta aegis]|uniref:28S ribosomal protein S28, mitochondrial-like n=1 Tax=Gigantopelta aegis TaxID=1735272 RepID=UPI001B88AFBD|nr:28S ribosomal protein S28, mitochondrial-like [Gigantopelta aegis]
MASTIRQCGFCYLRRSFLWTFSRNYCSSSKNTSSDNKSSDQQQNEQQADRPVSSNKDIFGEGTETVKRVSPMTPGEKALAGFARALEKAKHPEEAEIDLAEESPFAPDESFASMIRKSKLMQIGDPAGRTVLGKIIETVGDDLYIDFGAKFHCVCQRPNYLPEKFHRGTRVKLQLNELEMSSSFLGSKKHVTLLEADATLIGLHRKPLDLKQ